MNGFTLVSTYNPILFAQLAAGQQEVAVVQTVCDPTTEFEGAGTLVIPAGAYSVKWKNIEQETIIVNGENISAGGGNDPEAVFNPVSQEWELLEEYTIEVPINGCVRYTVCRPVNL